MGPSGNTFLGRNWDPRPGSEFTIFGLVIRLSKVEQLAIFHFSPCRLSLAEQLAAVPGFAFFRFSPCRLSLVEQPAAVPGFISFCQPWKLPFSTLIEDQLLALQHDKAQASGHAFQVWSLSFG